VRCGLVLLAGFNVYVAAASEHCCGLKTPGNDSTHVPKPIVYWMGTLSLCLAMHTLCLPKSINMVGSGGPDREESAAGRFAAERLPDYYGPYPRAAGLFRRAQ